VPTLSRRELLQWLGVAAAATRLPGCGVDTTGGDGVFTPAQLAMLSGLADVIIPADDQPGGSQLGVVPYIETLLNAFASSNPDDAPRIYAGGPVSNRSGGSTNDFASFIELDRVLELAWRVQIFGSAGVAGGAPNDALAGAAVALKDQLTAGLDMAQQILGGGPADYQFAFDGLPADFQQLIFDLVTQAAWAAPEYGGNPNLAGWQMVHFEGDSLPLGYSQFNGTGYTERPDSPMSTPNPADPEPLTADVEMLLDDVVSVLGGVKGA
jgi:hypothetical protein